MKELHWSDLKSFLTALAVGDFLSVANIISDEQVDKVIFDFDYGAQEFILGNIELNTRDYWNVGSQLEKMVRMVHKLFNTSSQYKPASIEHSVALQWIVSDEEQAVSSFIDFGKDADDKEYFLLDSIQKPWLREASRHLSKRELFKRKFEAQLYAHLIGKLSKNLAVDKSMETFHIGESSEIAHQDFFSRLFNDNLNEVSDYGDLATSIMDVKGLYSLIGEAAVPTEMSDNAWFNNFKSDWSDVYHQHSNMDWDYLQEQILAMMADIDKMMDKTKFRVETYWHPENTYHDWGFNIQFNLNGEWYRWIRLNMESDLDGRADMLAQVKYSRTLGQLVPKSHYQSIATKALCPVCDNVVNRHNETLPFFSPQRRMSRKLRTCFGCLERFATGYSIVHECFVESDTGIGGLVHVEQSSTELENLLDGMSLQIQRNIKRSEYLIKFFELDTQSIFEIRFVPDFTFYDYNQELDWHLFMIENGDYNIIKSTSSNHGPTVTQSDAVHKNFFGNREFLPIGMELEVQYRNEDSNLHRHYIENLVTPLHKKFPYERPTFGQRQQLAIGSRDSSIGYRGVEFKFQIMNLPFLADLPEEFFETLKTQWKGFHAKKCGIHLSTSKSALNRPESLVMLTYHNNHVRKYHNLDEGQLPHNIMGDVFQRVDVPSYAEWHEVRYSSGIVREDYPTSRDYRYATYLNAVVRNRQSVDRGNFINFANAENDRLEFRGFASATLKDRILKNFEYLDAMFMFARHLSENLPDDLSDIRDIPESDYELLHLILDNEIGFYFWLDMVGGFRKYPNLAAHLERHNIDRYLSNYEGEIQNALNDVF